MSTRRIAERAQVGDVGHRHALCRGDHADNRHQSRTRRPAWMAELEEFDDYVRAPVLALPPDSDIDEMLAARTGSPGPERGERDEAPEH